jgi:putative FmdB family regulatory protein
MPIISYKCRECGKEFSKIFFKPEDAPRECPVCSAANLQELGAAFQSDEQMARRVMGVSCEGCVDADSCSKSGSC